MIQFPSEFVKTPWPGYFWHQTEERLYSIKVRGVLRPMKLKREFYSPRTGKIPEGYCISVNGHRKIVTAEFIKSKVSNAPPVEWVDTWMT